MDNKQGEQFYKQAYELWDAGNLNGATELFEKAAEVGFVDAFGPLGDIYYLNYIKNSLSADYEYALCILHKALRMAIEGSMLRSKRSLRLLDKIADSDALKKVDSDRLEELVVANDFILSTRVWVGLAKCYKAKKDYKKVVTYYRRATQAGDAEAASNLAHCYEHGLGVDVDLREAYDLYLTGAFGGREHAMYSVGCFLYNAYHCDIPDKKRALEWFIKAAELDHHYAAYMIGVYYMFGFEVEIDYVKALDYMDYGIRWDLPQAYHNTAVIYEDGGYGVDKDIVKAIRYYEGGSRLGYVSSMYRLGLIYFNDRGEFRDREKAYDLFSEASRLGCKDSEKAILDGFSDC